MENKLPSAFQPKSKVGLQLIIDLLERARDGFVTSVRFTESKVRYDLQIPVFDTVDLNEKPKGWFRISNIDSAFLNTPYENGLHYNSSRDQQWREEEKNQILSAVNPVSSDKIPFYSEKVMGEFAQFVQSEVREALSNDDKRPITTEYFISQFKKTI